MEDANMNVRRDAIRALAQIAEERNADAITAVSAHVGDAYEGVRRAAVDALAQIAEKGNAGAIIAVFAHLERRGEQFWPVRRAALDALAQIVERGHAGAITAVSARLRDANGGVRLAAMRALSRRSRRKGTPTPSPRCPRA